MYVYRSTEGGKLEQGGVRFEGPVAPALRKLGVGLYAVTGGREGLVWYSVVSETRPVLVVQRIGGTEKAPAEA